MRASGAGSAGRERLDVVVPVLAWLEAGGTYMDAVAAVVRVAGVDPWALELEMVSALRPVLSSPVEGVEASPVRGIFDNMQLTAHLNKF